MDKHYGFMTTSSVQTLNKYLFNREHDNNGNTCAWLCSKNISKLSVSIFYLFTNVNSYLQR